MTYVCDMCKKTFEEDWTEEEALAELQENFGDYTPEECIRVCDDCYKAFMSGGAVNLNKESIDGTA